MSIAIAVVEDNKSFRDSLVELIRSTEGFELVGEYSNAEEALGLADKKPQIVILDIVLPRMSGLDLLKKIKMQNPGIQFLICSGHDDDDRIFSALEAGASGYILKDFNSSQIIEAIRELSNGGAPMSPYIAKRVIGSFQKKTNGVEQLLTDREKEILEQASRGLMYKEIAGNLGISHETVKRHLKNIYHKLHVQNKIEAINKFKS